MCDSEPIDLDFRPASYFRPQPLEDYRLAQVKNSQVRAHLRRLLASERHDEVARILREEGVSDHDCRALERIHPLYMGGNYLLNPRPGEVGIARIQIYSTTGDVAAVYARRVGPRIRYRVVDEYTGETLEGRTKRDSVKALTDAGCVARLSHQRLGIPRDPGSELRGRRRGHARVLRGRVRLLPATGRAVPAACPGGLSRPGRGIRRRGRGGGIAGAREWDEDGERVADSRSLDEIAEADWPAWFRGLQGQRRAEVDAELDTWLRDAPDWNWEDDYLPDRATGQGAAFEYFNDAGFEVRNALKIHVIEGDRPGSNYIAAELHMPIEEANAIAVENGWTILFVREGAA